jgi:steroid delta-isomerase
MSPLEGAEALVAHYLTRHAENDLEGVVALFEEDATVEDPVGSPIHHGIDSVRAFYAATHRSNGPMTIERVGAILVGGDEVALHVRAGLDKPGSPPAMDVIYVLRLGASGRISSLRAWFG